jgi:NADH-quinone oxidoreductase subunit M
MLASIGVPGLNGFVGEFLILIGTFTAHRWWAVVAIMGVIVAAIYLLWAYQQVFHGEPTPSDAKTRDLGWSERLVVAPLIILIVLLGVFPKPVLDRITPSVDRLIVHVDQATRTPIPSGLDPGSTTSSTSSGDASGAAPTAAAGPVAVWPSGFSAAPIRGGARR